jgi:hypothetical protein
MPASLPGLARATARALLTLRPRRVLTTLELLPTEYRDLLFLLPEDTRIQAASLDLSRPLEAATRLREVFGGQWSGPRRPGRDEVLELLAQQEQGHRASGQFWHWVGGLGVGQEPGAAPPPSPLPRPAPALPILVLGRGLLLGDLHELLEAEGAFVAHDEEPAAELLACLSEPEDFARQLFWRTRLEAALEAGRRARALGAIFVHEAFSGRALEEPLYARGLGLPLLSLPVEEPGPVDGSLKLRVQAFLELLRRRESGP